MGGPQPGWAASLSELKFRVPATRQTQASFSLACGGPARASPGSHLEVSHSTVAMLPQGLASREQGGAGSPVLPSQAGASGRLRPSRRGEGPRGRSRCLCQAQMAGSLCKSAGATGGCPELLLPGLTLP